MAGEISKPLALLTGASSGIGAAMAEQLAGEGHDLVLLGRHAARLESVAAQCRVRGAMCRTAAFDMRDRAAFAQIVAETEAIRPITLFVSNAGVLDGRHDGSALESGESARIVLDVNLMAAVDALHVVLPGMRSRRRGGIVLVSSLAAFAPLVDAPAYSASKSGLLSYGLALREALEPEGVTVTIACPGYVVTRMTAMHIGHRPWELSAPVAAARILKATRQGKAVCGFPAHLYWPSRISLFIPEAVRKLFTKSLRFHVGDTTDL